jgi:hypothetical protein
MRRESKAVLRFFSKKRFILGGKENVEQADFINWSRFVSGGQRLGLCTGDYRW